MTSQLMADIITALSNKDQKRALFDFWCQHQGLDDNPEALEEFERACGIVVEQHEQLSADWFKHRGLIVEDEFEGFPRIAK